MFANKEIKDSIKWRMRMVKKSAKKNDDGAGKIYIERGAKIAEMASISRAYEIMAESVAGGWTWYGAIINGTVCLIADR